jgi:hypothetical protein
MTSVSTLGRCRVNATDTAYSIAIDPVNPNRFYVGFAFGGVFRLGGGSGFVQTVKKLCGNVTAEFVDEKKNVATGLRPR